MDKNIGMPLRNITVYASNGKSGQVITSDATKLSEIQDNLRQLNISTDNMRLITDNEIELLGGESQLPAGDFTLFLMQKKSKAGSKEAKPSRKAIYDAIKSAIENGSATKEHFSHEGKDYTRVGSDLLVEKLSAAGIVLSPDGSIASMKKPSKAEGKKEKPAKNLPAPVVKEKPIAKPAEARMEKATPKTDQEKLSDALLSLAGINVPKQHQLAFNTATKQLGHISTTWGIEKPVVDNDSLKKQADKIRSKFSGLA